MMHQYYVNVDTKSNGDYEVHTENCINLPSSRNYIGYFATCDEAIKASTKNYPQPNGCKDCCVTCYVVR